MRLGRIGRDTLGCGQLTLWSYTLRLTGPSKLVPAYSQMFATRAGKTAVKRTSIQEYELGMGAVVVPHEQEGA